MRERKCRRWPWLALCVTVMLVLASSTRAATIQLPLNLNYLTLDAAMKATVFTQPGGRARLWEGGNDCQYLDATNPRFSREGSGTKLEADGKLVLGFPVGDHCVGPIDWTGIIEASLDPYMSALALKLRVTDINLFNSQHQKSALIGHGFDLIKQNFIPAIQTFSYDLAPSVRQLGQLAQFGTANTDDAARVRQAIATLKPAGPVIPSDTGMRITLQMQVPELPTVGATAPSGEAAAAAAAQQWQTALQNWDSFLVFAIKQFATAVPDPSVRQKLLDVLLDSRQRLVDALTQPASGPDPVRLLFLDEWTRLRDIIEEAAARGAIGDRTLEFLSFISAGDALFALDQAAPVLGIHISAEDLRRLARIMAPQISADPLIYNFEEDPELRTLLGIAPPLESDEPLDSSDEEPPSPTPTSSSLPSPSPQPLSSTDRSHLLRLLDRLVSLLDAKTAEAAATGSQGTLRQLGHDLHRTVVNDSNASRYRVALNQLLTLVASDVNDPGQNGKASIMPLLVKTTAWQESCWRQFEIRKQRVMFLESASGDIGLMQVNKYVWRGFYSLPRLKWDIVYNASAGTGILERLLLNAPNRSGGSPTDQRALARSVYSAYNGGPAAYGRWVHHGGNADARAADEGFAEKIGPMQQGQSFDILSCAAAWNHGRRD